jgi:DNA-binding transcriptional ArsR family regulator
MSRKIGDRGAHAVLFRAMGDSTRLALVAQLAAGQPRSIAQLTLGSRLTRQAIRKHLRVLERAGIVHGTHSGRQSLFQLATRPIEQMQDYLSEISRQWGEALERLKSFVET